MVEVEAEIIYQIDCPSKNYPAGIHPPAFSAVLVMKSRLYFYQVSSSASGVELNLDIIYVLKTYAGSVIDSSGRTFCTVYSGYTHHILIYQLKIQY
jgi:hypothetical protein